MSIKNPKQTKGIRRELRRNSTKAEELLWTRIRNKKLSGVRVRRQYGIGPYIIDFYVPKAHLAIEVDGKIHLDKEQKERDLNKDTFLRNNSIDVIRIENQEVFDNLNNVILKLESVLDKKLKYKDK